MNPKTKAILGKSPFTSGDCHKIPTGGIVNVGPHDPLPKVPNWEEMARERSQTFAHGLDGKAYSVGGSIQKEADRMGATVTMKHSSQPSAVVESTSSDIQIRLEILKILFSSPYIEPDEGFTTTEVESWVKTGQGIAFLGWGK